MHFYLISLIVIAGTTLLTWSTTKPVGILDIIPSIIQSAKEVVFGKSGNGLGIFAFGFFLYAILQSQAVQALFSSKKKWLQKKGWLTVALITITASILSTFLFWYDEFVHFYPLVIPLLLSMGFDTFSALLCLFGGSSAGLIAAVSSQSWSDIFQSHVNSHEKVVGKAVNFTGNDGMAFRAICWVIFTTIVVLFNIWYCNKIFRQPPQKKPQESNKLEGQEKNLAPVFNRSRKLILALFGFFVLGSILGQYPKIAKSWKSSYSEKISPKITNSYDGGLEFKGKEYTELGKIGHKEEEIKVAEVTEKKEGFWGKFGEWDSLQIYSWFVIGGIIICLIGKLSIPEVLVKSIQQTIPLLLAYILMQTPRVIAKNSGISELFNKLLPSEVNPSAKYQALFLAFLAPFVINLFLPGMTTIIMFLAVPLLLPISKETLLYGIIFIWMGRMLAETFSPSNGILRVSLETNKISYRQYLKKIWPLGMIILLTILALIGTKAFCIK